MAIPNPNPNIADGIKSDNKTYSSNKIESLIKTATELPIPEAGDAGKVLTVNAAEDGYELDTPVDPTSIIDDTASSADTVYSSSQVDTIVSGLKPVITEITPVSDTTTTATDFDAYTGTLDKGIYIFNGQTLWKTSGTAKGLTMILIVDSDTVNQNLEYTDGWCVENLTSIFEVTADNTAVTVRLYQTTGGSVDIEFKGNFTKIG